MLQSSFGSVSSVEDRYVGVRALWIKVIIRAAFDWVSYRDSLKLPQQKLAENAYKWLFCESNLLNSFENICYHFLDLSPEKIRKWACSITKEHVAKIEHLERYSSADLQLDRTINKCLLEFNELDEEILDV